MELLGQFVDVDGLVAEKHLLIAIDGDDQALLGDLPDGAGFGYGDVDAGLQDGRGDHEDDQQDEDHVDQGSDVDVRQ